MDNFIDLSHDIINNMPVHPYDDPVKLYQDKFLDKDKYNNFKLEIGMHAGTHIDTPMHLTNKITYINEIPLDNFMGNGCLLDVRGQNVITYKEKYADMVLENDVVILYTGWYEKFGAKEYFSEHPVVNKELAEFFIQRKIKILGLDLPSPDQYPFDIHKMLFHNDILIIENLTNLSKLISAKKFEIMSFPLKIRSEASMVRVVARVK
ncbi:cyclase family protein [Sporosalibacterium faouarense]|uniref:cyclase family protein n=1 Tax=Sporosalibacterium faouarense TaxID=516123 RepID=UPI00141C1B75|nr:cyclase family protein [Sporosalibacterium faouarense]MTI49961.1 cyclase family protein [Bacillota bacterium]